MLDLCWKLQDHFLRFCDHHVQLFGLKVSSLLIQLSLTMFPEIKNLFVNLAKVKGEVPVNKFVINLKQ